MRIKGLTPLMLSDLKRTKLKNSTVVLDGQNIFFSLYKQSNIPYAFGCESDQFANYIKTYLDKFKKANLDCIFVFKGGHKDTKSLDVHFEAENRLHGRNYVPGGQYEDIIKPVFAKDIWFQTLDDMGFKYVVCNEDNVTECISLALKLACPLIGNNMQYFFSPVQYVPELNTVLDEDNNLLCGVYTLSNFLKIKNLTEEKVILFIMLTDKHMFDDEELFDGFFESHRLLTRYNKINLYNMIKWLARYSAEDALKVVFRFLPKTDQELFMKKKTDLEILMQKRKSFETKMTLHVTDENEAKFTKSDPDWFEKGVFHKYIVIPYINLYRYKIIKASNFIEDYEQENSVMLSIDIIKYAFDLLTNFEGGAIMIEHKKDKSDNTGEGLTYESTVAKPDYEATLSVFENGWDNIKELNLFEHFVTESLETFDFARLSNAPADCRLLLIALVYFSRKKPDVQLEIYSILLSYVMLGVVSGKLNGVCDKSNDKNTFEKPFIDPLTDKDSVTASDCDVASSLMSKYFNLRNDELRSIFNRETLHPLVEFQRCLEELNYLNRLCGSQFEPTVFSKTYNGTFVYKLLHAMKMNDCEDGFEFIKKKLSAAPTVLAFLSGILGVYESLLYEY